MKLLKKLFHRHKWHTYIDNVYGENSVIFTLCSKHCDCGKSKIEFIYGSKYNK